MMETSLYTREYIYVKKLLDSGIIQVPVRDDQAVPGGF